MVFLLNFRAASIAQSATDSKRPRLVIWPEWSDADVNAEKWVSAEIYITSLGGNVFI